jgi:hypothetical protein
MYSESDLEAAVKAGALSPLQAHSFRNFVAQGRSIPAVDEESFRLLTGFNDIFVAISAVILLVAVAWIGHAIPPNIDGDGPSPWSALFVAATSWGLAEFFTKKRRMALPSILLLLAFVGASLGTAAITMITWIGEQNLDGNDRAAALILAFSTALGAGAAWAHWRRFRVPITVAAGAATVVGLVLALIASAVGDVAEREDTLLGFAFVLGIGVFMLAMRWDWSDPTRQTRRSDVAFWLHLLAAPLIVHPIFSLLGITEGHASTPIAVVVMLVYIGLGITALAIDRRALLVSALGYVLWALNNLFESYGVVELSIAFTALVIGSALLLLSAFWHNARRGVVQSLPPVLRVKLPMLDQPAVA